MTHETLDIAPDLLEKEERLKANLAEYGTLAVAYSGGVDSTYLSDVACEVLGAGATLILADSPSVPRSEFAEARDLARARDWRLEVMHTEEFDNAEYLKNDGRRCYFCRNELFEKMTAYALEHGIAVLAYGAIMDDLLDATRLGARAAHEHRVVAPLQDAGLSKDEIRRLSRRRGLPTWDKPSFACLASRLPTGARVTREALSQIERAEEALKRLGFRQYRVRHHGDLCRIEVDGQDIARFADPVARDEVVRALRDAGYRHVTLDLAGYRTGSTAGHPPATV